MKKSVDEALVHQIKDGDEDAFELMMIKYRPRILASLLRYTSSRELSEDLTQQTFLFEKMLGLRYRQMQSYHPCY